MTHSKTPRSTLNILIKLSAILSRVFCSFFINYGGLLTGDLGYWLDCRFESTISLFHFSLSIALKNAVMDKNIYLDHNATSFCCLKPRQQ
ncbi:MAG: hypothetical protein Ct9H300mP28_22270 [Pseudomonadota bacterium]|nr:MAG: hypothetical protein Ct9H300mP28_22270 [Pseudomonadota bacterium]